MGDASEDESVPEEEVPVEEDEEEVPEIVPVHTCYIVLRDIPLPLKAQLVDIKYDRGWKSWADMAYEVVKLWGGKK